MCIIVMCVYVYYCVSFEELPDIDYTGLELESTTSRYRKLVVDDQYAMTYQQWTYWCSGELLNK